MLEDARSDLDVRQILIVDDSKVIRKVAKSILQPLGFTTREAENGVHALEACKAMMPDGILLDWNMPEMDGLEFLAELRKLPGGLEPKVVFCTSENEISKISRAIQASADEYIMKPFDRGIMISKLEQVGLIQP